jgi:hypothetical protein
MKFPSYQSIHLPTTKIKWGYYVPALIEQYRPDIRLISINVDLSKITDQHGNLVQTHTEVDYSWLPAKIEQAFRFKKKIGLLIEDEHLSSYPNQQLIEIVNYYRDRPVYWLTQHDQKRFAKIYQDDHGLQCKILELPWLILNESLMYDKIRAHRISTIPVPSKILDNKQNAFFTLTGRHEPFRKRLLEKLVEHDLHTHGLLTIANDSHDYGSVRQHVTVESCPPYTNHPIKKHAKMAAQFLENNMWTGSNTQNFLHIEQTYSNYPLAIIPETFFSDYFSTEKSVWPALLGKMFLIFGSAGCMTYIQRFYDINLSEFLNLDYDCVERTRGWNIDHRIDCMLESNKDFILNSHKFYNQNFQRIQTARNTLGPNLYQFVLNQVALIQ